MSLLLPPPLKHLIFLGSESYDLEGYLLNFWILYRSSLFFLVKSLLGFFMFSFTLSDYASHPLWCILRGLVSMLSLSLPSCLLLLGLFLLIKGRNNYAGLGLKF